MKKLSLLTNLLLSLCVSFAFAKDDVLHVRDIAFIEGIRTNQLIGYGIVSGLDGTGDSNSSLTNESTINLLKSLGLNIPIGNNNFKNVAVVTITGEIPSFSKIGQKIDITVSSIGSAKSLKSGVLMLTPLKGVDGQVYALAQGPILLNDNKGTQLTGQILSGATLEKEVNLDLSQFKSIRLYLKNADFELIQKLSNIIKTKLNAEVKAVDSRTLELVLPIETEKKVSLLADVMSISVDKPIKEYNAIPKIIINSKTNTIVTTERIEVGKCTISFNNITLNVDKTFPSKTTDSIQNSISGVVVNSNKTYLSDILTALRRVGATTQDLIGIIQTLKVNNALNAEIELL